MDSERPSDRGSVAIVTGAGRNIGRAVAIELAQAGADVVVVVRDNRDEAESVAEEVRRLGRRAIVGITDVRDADGVKRIANEAREVLGPPTILVNGAAARPEAAFLDLTLSDWREVIGVILDGAFACTQEIVPDMLEAGWGRIVMIAGLSGQTGASHRAHVVTGKAGLIGMTKALALEYASDNITVNAVSPGMIDTARAGASPKHHSERRIPVGRLGRPEEVAAMVRHLVSDDAAFITGQTFNVNGGLL